MFPVFGIASLALFGSILMLLWNWLIPSIFGLTTINFWQALGLFALSRLLFSGMGFGGCGRHKHNGNGFAARKKWMKMTPEERNEWFKNRGCRGNSFHAHDERDSETEKKKSDTPDNG